MSAKTSWCLNVFAGSEKSWCLKHRNSFICTQVKRRIWWRKLILISIHNVDSIACFDYSTKCKMHWSQTIRKSWIFTWNLNKAEYLNKNVRSSNLCTTPLIINFIQCTNQCIVNIILSNVLDLQVYRHYGHLESAQYSN